MQAASAATLVSKNRIVSIGPNKMLVVAMQWIPINPRGSSNDY